MRRISLLAVMFAVAVPYAFAQDQDLSKVQLKVTKVSGNVYMIEGVLCRFIAKKSAAAA